MNVLHTAPANATGARSVRSECPVSARSSGSGSGQCVSAKRSASGSVHAVGPRCLHSMPPCIECIQAEYMECIQAKYLEFDKKHKELMSAPAGEHRALPSRHNWGITRV